MIISTTENISGYEVTETLGTTFGVVVRARGIGGDILAQLKGLVGGEVHQYTQKENKKEPDVELKLFTSTVLSDDEYQSLFVEPLKKTHPEITLTRLPEDAKIEDLITAGNIPDIIFGSAIFLWLPAQSYGRCLRTIADDENRCF